MYTEKIDTFCCANRVSVGGCVWICVYACRCVQVCACGSKDVEDFSRRYVDGAYLLSVCRVGERGEAKPVG